MKRSGITHIFSLFLIFLLVFPFIASADDVPVAGKAGTDVTPPRVSTDISVPAGTDSPAPALVKPLNSAVLPETAVGNPSLHNEPIVLRDKDVVPEAQCPAPAPVPPAQEVAPADPAAATSSIIGNYDQNATASKAVKANLGLFSTRIKEKFSLWLSRSGKYLDLMKDILKKKDVPEDMVFLSLIESGFNPYAYSMAKAVGPWQFIASTARRYGLEINWWTDERRDPVKSTEAAADYLKDLYGMFGSWNLAMAAYNAGEGKILKALKRSNADNYWDLLHTRHIREETKEYVPKFIAASLIANNPQDFGFDDIEYNQPMRYDEVRLDEPIDLAVAAECAGTDLDTIKKLNPELRRWCTPPDVSHYILRIPEGTKAAFQEKLAEIPDGERFTIDRYKVRRGDTFRKIARRTGIPASVILALNSTEKVLPLRTGSAIYLPPKEMLTLDADDRAFAKKVSYVRKAHRVRRGSHKQRGKRAAARRKTTRQTRHVKHQHGRKS
jgi:membrane-bound lytic murein transglycosylase D